MTQDAVDFLSWFFPNIWQFFIAWKIPGTGVTPAGWLLFLVVAFFVWRMIKYIMHSGWIGDK